MDLKSLKYVALSYVWGQSSPRVELKTVTYNRLLSPGSLSRLTLPKTIADALELSQKLGFDYLWVDALCIIQDSEKDQKQQISYMASIYQFAYITIEAASGADTSGGLPGFRPHTRMYTQEETVVIPPERKKPGLALMTTVKSCPTHWDELYRRGHEDMDTSVWNTRGWTLQEHVLSRRRLIFTKEQVLFSCKRAFFCEESDFEVPGTTFRHFNATAHRLDIGDHAVGDAFWDLYRNLVEQYSQRNLTCGGDVHDAFSAMLEVLGHKSGEKFLWGLPKSRLALALTWDTVRGVRRRTELSKLPMTNLNRRVQFPSWSWMGWVGDAHCWVSDERSFTYGNCPESVTLTNPALYRDSPTITCYLYQPSVANLIRTDGTALDSADGIASLDQAEEIGSMTASDFGKFSKGLVPNLSTYPDGYVLIFFAYSASLSISYPGDKGVASTPDKALPTVMNKQGKQIGRACRCAEAHAFRGNAEFIQIARRATPDIPEIAPEVIALQIEWKDGVAYRVNIAEIDEREWKASAPSLTLIQLG